MKLVCPEPSISAWAGLNFYAGYPFTSSTEIAELLFARLPIQGAKLIQYDPFATESSAAQNLWHEPMRW